MLIFGRLFKLNSPVYSPTAIFATVFSSFSSFPVFQIHVVLSQSSSSLRRHSILGSWKPKGVWLRRPQLGISRASRDRRLWVELILTTMKTLDSDSLFALGIVLKYTLSFLLSFVQIVCTSVFVLSLCVLFCYDQWSWNVDRLIVIPSCTHDLCCWRTLSLQQILYQIRSFVPHLPSF